MKKDQKELCIDTIQKNTFYSRTDDPDRNHEHIVFVLRVNREEKTISAILLEDLFEYVLYPENKEENTIKHIRAYDDFLFYPLSKKEKVIIIQQKSSLTKTINKRIIRNAEYISDLIIQREILKES